MSDPLVDPSDLCIYMQADTINEDRAAMLLADAQSLCQTVVFPLPVGAEAVIRRMAAAAYINPSGARVTALGSGRVEYGSSRSSSNVTQLGVVLTSSDRRDLRALNGGSSAYSIDILPPGRATVQLVALTGSPAGGTFDLSFLGQPTAGLAPTVDGVVMQAALQALSAVGPGNMLVSGVAGGPWTVTGAALLATGPLPLLVADYSALTGDPAATVTVATVIRGVLAPGQCLPRWDYDYLTLR